jgi:hypothetical protein
MSLASKFRKLVSPFGLAYVMNPASLLPTAYSMRITFRTGSPLGRPDSRHLRAVSPAPTFAKQAARTLRSPQIMSELNPSPSPAARPRRKPRHRSSGGVLCKSCNCRQICRLLHESRNPEACWIPAFVGMTNFNACGSGSSQRRASGGIAGRPPQGSVSEDVREVQEPSEIGMVEYYLPIPAGDDDERCDRQSSCNQA